MRPCAVEHCSRSLPSLWSRASRPCPGRRLLRLLSRGAEPSKLAKMVCLPKAVQDIDEIVGGQAVVADKAWVKHLYSCQYRYGTGTMVLSVKELSSWSQTLSYFKALAKTMGKKMALYDLGQGAFKDSKRLGGGPQGLEGPGGEHGGSPEHCQQHDQ